MSDLIDKQVTIDALVAETIYTKEELREYHEANSHRNEWVNGIYEAVEVIEQLPPTQPERKTGRWRRMPMACYGGGTITEYECSNCEEHQVTTSNFCPNCGADMRGEQNEP